MMPFLYHDLKEKMAQEMVQLAGNLGREILRGTS
jgi:hypothetical protein